MRTHAKLDSSRRRREQLDARFSLARVFAERGVRLESLDEAELRDLEEALREPLFALVDNLAAAWKERHGYLSERERIDRELRRQIVNERDPLDTQCSCEGCGYRHWDIGRFLEFHGLLLCDGCFDHARDVLRELQRRLIRTLETELTLEHAAALGFELIRLDNGRLAWVSDGEQFDGDDWPYTGVEDALYGLLDELL